jgi:anti-anti-sigma regulatory factor
MPGLTANVSDGSQHVCLLPAMDLRAATPLKATLDDALGKALPLVIEAAPVERMSTARIQMLIAFVDAARKAGISVTFSRPSPAFLGAFESLGLASVIAHWKVEH